MFCDFFIHPGESPYKRISLDFFKAEVSSAGAWGLRSRCGKFCTHAAGPRFLKKKRTFAAVSGVDPVALPSVMRASLLFPRR